MNYDEGSIIFVAEWCNIMYTGGIFQTEASLHQAIKEANFVGDIRLLKITLIQDFIRGMINFRISKGLL